MPFQSEKQRRYLHANHPEIAKRWERDYGEGGIAALNAQLNQLPEYYLPAADGGRIGYIYGGILHPGGRRGFPGGAGRPDYDPMPVGGSGANYGGGNGGNGGTHPIHTGPTVAELAEDEARLQALEDAKRNQIYEDTMKRRANKKSKVKRFKDYLIKETKKVPSSIIKKGIGEKLIGATTTGFLPYVAGSAIWGLGKKIINKEPIIQTDKTAALDDSEYEVGKVATLSTKGLIEYNKLINKKNANTATDGMTPPLTDKEKERLKQLEKDKESKLTTDTGTAFVANGGILGINESEEIISDDGNDIELTDYNAAFDDPNDLSTGVRTLFQAKEGGTPQLAKKSSDGKRPGYQGWPGPGAGAPEATSSSTGGGGEGYQDRIIEVQERTRKQDLKDLVATGPGSDVEKYDTDLVGMTDNQKYKARKNAILSKYTGRSSQRKNALTTNYQTEKARLEKKLKGSLLLKGLMLVMGMPVGIKDFVSVDWKNKSLKGPLKTAMTLDQLKKDHIKSLTDIKESFLVDVDINNPNEMANLDDTAFPDVMKELKDLTKPREEDDPGPHDPVLPKVISIGEEIEEYEGTYAMSPWERIKANQAKRAMLVEKGIIQENPIVDESVADITMQANSGGLANLFRVKNQ